jgi:hypothetical protein
MPIGFVEYVDFVEQTSDYAPASRRESGLCGVISEVGEVLALFDERRIKRKGLPSWQAILSELGDVLWYEVWRAGQDAREAGHWNDSPLMDASEDPVIARNVVRHVFLSPRMDGEAQNSTRRMLMSFGFTLAEIAEANVAKLTARREAGTLHDREARTVSAAEGGE